MTEGHQVSKYGWKNSTDRRVQCRVVANLQFVKSTVSVKHSKAEHNKMGYACYMTEYLKINDKTKSIEIKEPCCSGTNSSLKSQY